MNSFLIDVAGGDAVVYAIPFALLFFFFVWSIIEGTVIYLYKINTYWRSVWHAVIVNLASFLIGIVLVYALANSNLDLHFGSNAKNLPVWVGGWLISVVVEGLLLKALNSSKSWKRIFTASIVMNIVSYLLLYGFYFFAGHN